TGMHRSCGAALRGGAARLTAPAVVAEASGRRRRLRCTRASRATGGAGVAKASAPALLRFDVAVGFADCPAVLARPAPRLNSQRSPSAHSARTVAAKHEDEAGLALIGAPQALRIAGAAAFVGTVGG